MTLFNTMHLLVLLRENAMKVALFLVKLVHLAFVYILTICFLCWASKSERLAFDSFYNRLIFTRRLSNEDLLQSIRRIDTSSRLKCPSVLAYCELIFRRQVRVLTNFLWVHWYCSLFSLAVS